MNIKKMKVFLFIFLKNVSIKNKIFFSNVLIIVITISAFAYFTGRISKQAIINKASSNSTRELLLINKSIEKLTNNVEDYIRILSMDYRLQQQLQITSSLSFSSIAQIDSDKILSKVISNVVSPATIVSAVSILKVDNTPFDVGYVDNSGISSVLNNDFIQYAANIKKPVWTKLFKLKYKYGGEENVFGIAKNITDFDTGKRIGTAVMYLKESDIASVYLDDIINKDEKIFILDKEDKIISCQDKKDLYNEFNNSFNLGNFKLADIKNNSKIINISDKQFLVSEREFNKLSWKIVSIVPIDQITTENKQITKFILIIGVICIIIAFAASYLVADTITIPILKLVKVMKDIKNGNRHLRVEINSTDEMQLLGEGFNNLMDKIKDLMDEIYYEQKLKRENEFKLLQSQIKPHFLYNTLETIISFIKLDLKENAVKTTKALAGFYRISLSKGNDIITIQDEVQLTNSYLSIQRLRYTEYMDYNISFDEEILKYRIPKLTLQPIIENAIYHGLKQKEDKGMVTIKGYKQENAIVIEILDDGVGMEKAKINELINSTPKTNNVDFGVSSVNLRLKLLYGDQYGLNIESKIAEYTKVIIKIPIIDA